MHSVKLRSRQQMRTYLGFRDRSTPRLEGRRPYGKPSPKSEHMPGQQVPSTRLTQLSQFLSARLPSRRTCLVKAKRSNRIHKLLIDLDVATVSARMKTRQNVQTDLLSKLRSKITHFGANGSNVSDLAAERYFPGFERVSSIPQGGSTLRILGRLIVPMGVFGKDQNLPFMITGLNIAWCHSEHCRDHYHYLLTLRLNFDSWLAKRFTCNGSKEVI